MVETSRRKWAGRREAPGGGKKTHAVTVRITAQTRGDLERAAAESGRTVASEAEYRMRLGFEHERADYEQFSGADRFRVFRAMADAVAVVESVTGKKVNDDAETFLAAREAALRIFPLIAPGIGEKIKAEVEAFFAAAAAYDRRGLPERPLCDGPDFLTKFLVEAGRSEPRAAGPMTDDEIEEWRERYREMGVELPKFERGQEPPRDPLQFAKMVGEAVARAVREGGMSAR